MALDESALPELLDALRAGDGMNLIRDGVRLVMQELTSPTQTSISRSREAFPDSVPWSGGNQLI